MAEQIAELIIKLIDDCSEPARVASSAIKGLTNDVAKAGMSFESFSRGATQGFSQAISGLTKTAIAAGDAAASARL